MDFSIFSTKVDVRNVCYGLGLSKVIKPFVKRTSGWKHTEKIRVTQKLCR